MTVIPVEYSLSELVEVTAALLRRADVGAEDERVRDVPDARTLRYYQTLGVLDRPLRYDGRRAVYGHRHLLQAVCTKLLQARGLSLAQVQAALRGASNTQLQAALDDALGSAAPSPERAPEQAPEQAPLPAPSPLPSPRPLRSAELAPGVWVTLDPSLVADPDDLLRRLRAAARPGGLE
ncbi:MAG: MerR family transcriptional regulator [Alphaproteobacteria bacterium]|nr:MerR family transcriptional regulator [Alphaproteobacteria bacterium]